MNPHPLQQLTITQRTAGDSHQSPTPGAPQSARCVSASRQSNTKGCAWVSVEPLRR